MVFWVSTTKACPSLWKALWSRQRIESPSGCFRQAKKEETNANDDEESPDNTTPTTSNIIFIGGSSGTGKSALIQAAFHGVDALEGCGKFEHNKGNAAAPPFSAVVQCLSEVCENMARHDEEEYAGILTETIQQDELAVLVNLVPKLLIVLRDNIDIQQQQQQQHTYSGRSKDDLERLKRLLCLFLQAIALAKRPLLLILDDLHWMDEASCALLKSILFNSQIKHLVFVGSFRNDEIDSDQHVLSKWIMDDVKKRMQK